jgi:hypothetical protein
MGNFFSTGKGGKKNKPSKPVAFKYSVPAIEKFQTLDESKFTGSAACQLVKPENTINIDKSALEETVRRIKEETEAIKITKLQLPIEVKEVKVAQPFKFTGGAIIQTTRNYPSFIDEVRAKNELSVHSRNDVVRKDRIFTYNDVPGGTSLERVTTPEANDKAETLLLADKPLSSPKTGM